MITNLLAIGMIIIAYLCGSLSSAIILCKLMRLPDPRMQGSGNPGATNVLRIAGPFPAAMVLVFDVLKGMLPVWLAYHLRLHIPYLGLIAIAACLGHIYPLFFNFQGGKGVATAFGAMAPIGWGFTGILFATWLAVALITGYSSVAAIISALVAPLFVWWLKPELTLPTSMLSCLILWRHYDNIQRLLRGQESKIWRKKT